MPRSIEIIRRLTGVPTISVGSSNGITLLARNIITEQGKSIRALRTLVSECEVALGKNHEHTTQAREALKNTEMAEELISDILETFTDLIGTTLGHE